MTSNIFKQEAFAQETEEALIVLIEMTSDEISDPIRICSDPYEKLISLGQDIYGVVSNGVEYVFLPFEIVLPRDDKTGSISARLSIENIDRQMIPAARSIRKPLKVNIKLILSNDVDYVEQEFEEFYLSNVSYDVFTLSGDLTMDYWELEPFPSGTFNPAKFPGLF